MNNLNLAMVLSLKDKLVGPLNRAVSQAERNFKELETAATKTAKSTATVADNLNKVGRAANSTRQVASEMRKLGDETERAGREMSKLQLLSGSLRGLLRGGMAIGAGTMAFNHVVSDPLRQAANYDTALRQLSNTAFAGQSLAARRAGIGTLNGAITQSVRQGGGTREQALSALNELVSSGVFENASDATAVLPMIMRGATASGADPANIAQIAIRARQNMGVKGAEGLGEVLDRAMAAGQAGGFELKDMAKYLPQQMALGRSLGLNGINGITTLLAANQASVITAGTRDEAGNNLVNLLAKVNSQDTAHDFQKIGIDLTGTLAKANGKGMNSLDAFVSLVDKVVGSDPRFVKAKAAAQRATGTDREAATNAQLDLLQGSSIGKVVQDRQALMALIALMNNRSYLKDVTEKVGNAKGSVNDAAALITEGAGYKFDQRNFEEQRAQTEAMTGANSAVAKLAEAQIDLYQRYPGFATALEGAKVAVTGLGAAAAAAGAMNLLAGRGGAAAAGGFLGGGGTAVASAAAGALSLGAMAAVAAPALASINTNREFVSAVADPSMMGSADFAGALADSVAQSKAMAEAAKAAAERPVQVNVHLDGRQIESTVTGRQDAKARRQ